MILLLKRNDFEQKRLRVLSKIKINKLIDFLHWQIFNFRFFFSKFIIWNFIFKKNRFSVFMVKIFWCYWPIQFISWFFQLWLLINYLLGLYFIYFSYFSVCFMNQFLKLYPLSVWQWRFKLSHVTVKFWHTFITSLS